MIDFLRWAVFRPVLAHIWFGGLRSGSMSWRMPHFVGNGFHTRRARAEVVVEATAAILARLLSPPEDVWKPAGMGCESGHIIPIFPRAHTVLRLSSLFLIIPVFPFNN